MDDSHKDIEIIIWKIPPIEVYQITDEQFTLIEEGCGKVSQDFTFATNFLSFGIAFLLALLGGTFSEVLRTIFIMIVVVCAFGCLYTGVRWWRQRKKVPDVIAKIRSRKTEPQAQPPEQHG